jgi:hypothetical protein
MTPFRNGARLAAADAKVVSEASAALARLQSTRRLIQRLSTVGADSALYQSLRAQIHEDLMHAAVAARRVDVM